MSGEAPAAQFLRAWCSDCEWTAERTPWVMQSARSHCDSFGHLVHSTDSVERCSDLDVHQQAPYECILTPGHPGPHRQYRHRWG